MGSYNGRAWGLGSACASLEIKLDFPKFLVRYRLIGKCFKEWGWVVYNLLTLQWCFTVMPQGKKILNTGRIQRRKKEKNNSDAWNISDEKFYAYPDTQRVLFQETRVKPVARKEVNLLCNFSLQKQPKCGYFWFE